MLIETGLNDEARIYQHFTGQKSRGGDLWHSVFEHVQQNRSPAIYRGDSEKGQIDEVPEIEMQYCYQGAFRLCLQTPFLVLHGLNAPLRGHTECVKRCKRSVSFS
jgi:hypothetical protein